MEKKLQKKLTYTANPPININTYYTFQVILILITRKTQFPTALLSVYDVFVQKMTYSKPDQTRIQKLFREKPAGLQS